MHLALAYGTARARWRVQGELSLRLAAADSARVGEAGLIRRELAVNGFRVTGYIACIDAYKHALLELGLLSRT